MPDRSDKVDSLVAVLLGLAGAIVFALYYFVLLGGRPYYWPDTYEYAQAGRALAETGRLVTNSCSVLEFWFLYRGTLPVPYFFHDPGNSVLLAAAFRAFGASDIAIPLASGACFSLLPPVTFLIGRGLFDRSVGLVAAALVVGNPQLLTFSATGLSEVPAALGATLVWGLLLLRPSKGRALVAGAVFGLLVVLRSSFVACAPWVLLFLWLGHEGGSRRRSLAAPACFVVGLAVFTAPSTLRSYVAAGRPLFAVASYYMPLFATEAIKGEAKALYSQPGFPVEPGQYFSDHPAELLQKAGRQLGGLVIELGRGGTGVGDSWVLPVVLFLFLLGGLSPPASESPQQRRSRYLAYLLFLTPIGLGLLLQIRLRYLYPFLPMVLVYDADLLCRVLARPRMVDGGRRILAPLAVAVFALSALPASLASGVPTEVREMWARDDYFRGLGAFLRENTRPGAVILAQLPELRPLAWHGRREIVELSDYTLVKVEAQPRRGPLFILRTSGPGKSRLRDFPAPGFSPVGAWESKSGERAVLLREAAPWPSR